MKYEAPKGVSISELSENMFNFSKSTGEDLESEFNGVRIFVTPYLSKDFILGYYNGFIQGRNSNNN